MRLYRILNLLVLICVAGLLACNSSKAPANGKSCKTEGQVQDFTGLDGCKLLIVTNDGKKLLPAKMPDSDVQLEAGMKIRFDFKAADMMSVCMAEDMIVELTCLEIVK